MKIIFFIQLNFLSIFKVHSMYSPYKRINMNIKVRKIINLLGIEVIVIKGIKSIISVSKIRKIILMRKN